MNFAADPILGNPSPLSQDQFASLSEEWKKLCALQQQKASINMQPQQSKTPIWDEIDKIMDGLTEAQKGFLNSNPEFADSYQDVVNILQREYMRIMRPIVEETKDGKDALENHLTLIKRLRKSAMQEEEKKSALWRDYMEHYSDKSWQEYIEIINSKKGNKK